MATGPTPASSAEQPGHNPKLKGRRQDDIASGPGISDGLDLQHLHPYMWLLKPHYYYGDLHFYNYPYAFGLLFGLGMYAIYLREGRAFVPRYKELLRSTGEGKVAPLAARFGIDVRSKAFWDESLGIIARQIDRYCELGV